LATKGRSVSAGSAGSNVRETPISAKRRPVMLGKYRSPIRAARRAELHVGMPTMTVTFTRIYLSLFMNASQAERRHAQKGDPS
jgi:hypothetical protein